MKNTTHECQQILVISLNNIFASQGFFIRTAPHQTVSQTVKYTPIKIPTFNTTICQGFVMSGEDQKLLNSEDE